MMPAAATANGTPRKPPRGAAFVPILLIACGLSCGKKGPPSPPEPRGPLAPRGVVARQIGTEFLVTFEVPAARGSRPAQQPTRAELVRVDYPEGTQPPQDPDAFRRRGRIVDALEAEPLASGSRLTLQDRDRATLGDRWVGKTLRYAIRVRDRRGRPSPLVVARDLKPLEVVVAPPALIAEPTADGMRLSWEAPAGIAGAQFNLYRSTAGQRLPEDPLNAEPLQIPGYLDEAVVTGTRYDYEVRVVLAPGKPYREGVPGIARGVLAADRFAPAAPQGLVAVQEGPAIRLFWNPGKERDLAGYRVYRRLGEGAWQRIGPDPVGQPLYLDDAVRAGQRLAYRVSAVDRVEPPNESGSSEVFEVEVRQEPAPGERPEP